MDEHESYMQDEHIERPTYGFTYEWTMNVFYEKKALEAKLTYLYGLKNGVHM